MNKKIPLSEYRKVIKALRSWDIDPFNYYKHILLNNTHYWNFVDPMRCKKSFQTACNMLKFHVLKRLLKQGYRLKAQRKDRYTFEYILYKKG